MTEENIIDINSRTFQLSGVELGNVKFVITPYLNLPILEKGKNTYKTSIINKTALIGRLVY